MDAAAVTTPRGMGYAQARRLIIASGLAVLAITAAIMWFRRVETAEVVAILLFIPVFLAFVIWDVKGGIAAGVAAAGIYAAVRWPAIDAVGAGRFAGLLLSRSLAFITFGAIGGWADRQLEQSLVKLDLYDQIDDATGLFNARFLVQDTDLEMARSQRYQTLFSVAVVDIPVAAFDALPRRRRSSLLREVGTLLRESVRNVDRAAHASDAHHRFAVICPETGPEGVRIFADRLGERMAAFLAERGVTLAGPPAVQALTFPGDDDAVRALQASFRRIDEQQHVPATR